jgi:ubiquitin carboxyl-terminal hydrolase 14
MNSTMQCLISVPELKSELSNYQSARTKDVDQTSHMLTVATRELFSELDKSVKAVAPMPFWMVLQKKYPQFAQLHNGNHMQQDAEECWTQMLYTLSQSLKLPSPSEDPDAVKALFGLNLLNRLHCQESSEESSETESVFSLKCHISHEVNHLHEGLKHVSNYINPLKILFRFIVRYNMIMWKILLSSYSDIYFFSLRKRSPILMVHHLGF